MRTSHRPTDPSTGKRPGATSDELRPAHLRVNEPPADDGTAGPLDATTAALRERLEQLQYDYQRADRRATLARSKADALARDIRLLQTFEAELADLRRDRDSREPF